jgi:hypothetical protein
MGVGIMQECIVCGVQMGWDYIVRAYFCECGNAYSPEDNFWIFGDD